MRGEILQLMLRLVRETGVTILVVTHDLGLAWNIADRVAVMYLGRIVEEGPTEELLDDPRHPYTRALLSVVPEVERMEQQILQGEAPDPTRIPPGLPLPSALPARRVGEAERLGIERALRGRGSGAPADRNRRGRVGARRCLSRCRLSVGDTAPVLSVRSRRLPRPMHAHPQIPVGG